VTIQDLGSIGEFIAALATLATLGYLAMQIRQNSKLLGETAKRATQEAVYASNLLVVTNHDVADMIRRGMSDYSSLDGGDRTRFHNFWMTTFINYQEAFYQVRQLGVDDEWWKVLEKHMLSYLRSPGLAEWWREDKNIFGADFVEFVDQRLGEAAAATNVGP